ncbi:hypothetical protein Fmac_017871 [Flemingia macrophylla]|uniref:Uncharacterized protein n=1 Tax=Flemingia macrophylla TaxID=520843 RepID=A0ABD1M585_9FABA
MVLNTQKERIENSNSNPRRSTSHKTLPRGRSSSPSDLPRFLSAQKPTLDPTPKPKPKPSLKLKLSTTGQESTDTISNRKYPSKLHEKLAFLKGKVKRITSDIKKTEEMLDLNNPDASKLILFDI